MSTKAEKLQEIHRQYRQEYGIYFPSAARDVVRWAIEKGTIDMPKTDPLAALTQSLTRALRTEYRIDEKGRRYRVNHAVKTVNGSVQTTLWADIDFAPHNHMEKAFNQRREQIVDDCVQLQTDIDVYNDKNKEGHLIQLILNFEDDVAERQHWQKTTVDKKVKKSNENAA